jgi:hypothetical protein
VGVTRLGVESAGREEPARLFGAPAPVGQLAVHALGHADPASRCRGLSLANEYPAARPVDAFPSHCKRLTWAAAGVHQRDHHKPGILAALSGQCQKDRLLNLGGDGSVASRCLADREGYAGSEYVPLNGFAHHHAQGALSLLGVRLRAGHPFAGFLARPAVDDGSVELGRVDQPCVDLIEGDTGEFTESQQFGTTTMRETGNTFAVMKAMGHASVQSMEPYQHALTAIQESHA